MREVHPGLACKPLWTVKGQLRFGKTVIFTRMNFDSVTFCIEVHAPLDFAGFELIVFASA